MNKVFKFQIIISTVLSVIAGVALADTKIGMITTLSGGGAGLGVDAPLNHQLCPLKHPQHFQTLERSRLKNTEALVDPVQIHLSLFH